MVATEAYRALSSIVRVTHRRSWRRLRPTEPSGRESHTSRIPNSPPHMGKWEGASAGGIQSTQFARGQGQGRRSPTCPPSIGEGHTYRGLSSRVAPAATQLHPHGGGCPRGTGRDDDIPVPTPHPFIREGAACVHPRCSDTASPSRFRDDKAPTHPPPPSKLRLRRRIPRAPARGPVSPRAGPWAPAAPFPRREFDFPAEGGAAGGGQKG